MPNTETRENWLGIIPRMQHARSVPMIDPTPKQGRRPRGVAISDEPWPVGHHNSRWSAAARVDLSDNQGFVYALRWLFEQDGGREAWAAAMADLGVSREKAYWHARDLALRAAAQDDDRVALAKALREVVP